MGGIWGAKPPPQTPIKNNFVRFQNMFLVHWRGIFGILVFPWIIIAILGGPGGDKKSNIYKSIQAAYIYLLSYFLFRPVSLPIACTLPIFWFPLFFILTTMVVVKLYFGAVAGLMLLGGMFTLLANQTNLDKKVAFAIIQSGSKTSYTGPKMILRAAVAAFVTAIFSNSLISAQKVYDILMPAFANIPGEVFDTAAQSMARDIIFNTVQVASTLGSLVVFHNNYCLLTFKATYLQSLGKAKDPFNYLQYTAFALPCLIAILVATIIYHIVLFKWKVNKTWPVKAMDIISGEIGKQKTKKANAHQWVAVFFLIIGYILLFFRDSPWTGSVWSTSKSLDVSIIASIVILLHMLPRDVKFLKYFKVKKESELGSIKPASAILWWRYVDRNTNYAYLLVLGCGVALWEGIHKNGFCSNLQSVFKTVLNLGHKVSPLLIIIYTIVMAFFMPGPAVVILVLPVVLCMGITEPKTLSGEKACASASSFTPPIWMLCCVMAVGIAANFGFTTPFLYSPAYYCHYQAKVKRSRQVFMNLGMCLIAAAILWVFVIFLGPAIFVAPRDTAADATPPPEGAPPDAPPERALI